MKLWCMLQALIWKWTPFATVIVASVWVSSGGDELPSKFAPQRQRYVFDST